MHLFAYIWYKNTTYGTKKIIAYKIYYFAAV